MRSRKPTSMLMALAMAPYLYLSQPAWSQSPQEVAKKTFPSVVLLTMEDSARQPISLGSGFFIADGIVATNYHVIEGASSGRAKLVGKKESLEIKGTVGIDLQHDLVLLSVEHKDAPALTLAEDAGTSIGDNVFVVGNPQGLEGTFSEGIISGIREIEKDRLLQITAPISPGSSGGPVLNEKGQVIGVAVATLKSGQNLNFAIPATALRELLKNKTEPKQLGSMKPDKEKKSIIQEFGGSLREGVKCTAFEWSYKTDMGAGNFTFSIKNELPDSMCNVFLIVVFYDRKGEPIEALPIKFKDTIPSHLARRASGRVDGSIQRMTTRTGAEGNPGFYQRTPETKLEFRVLDFTIVRE